MRQGKKETDRERDDKPKSMPKNHNLNIVYVHVRLNVVSDVIDAE